MRLKNPVDQKEPLFSIIIPSYNRAHSLYRLLSSFNDSTCDPGTFEIIVVDDGSDPPLYVETGKYPFSLILLRQQNKGPAQARNNGALISKGKYLLFTDDDCIPYPNWITSFLNTINHQPDLVIGGRIINGLPENIYSQVTQLLFDYLHENRYPGKHQVGFFTTNNLCVPKKIFSDLKGFNALLRFGEDREFCSRLTLNGKRLEFANKAIVYHFHHLTFLSFLKLHFQYGTGTNNFYLLAHFEKPRKPLVMNLSFYVQLILSPFKNSDLPKAFLYSALLIVTQFSNLAGYIWQAFTPLQNIRSHEKE